MRSPNKFQSAAIAAASVLVAYMAAMAGIQTNHSPKVVDIPPVLLAEGAAVDYFLKLEGVDGESTDEMHKGQIEIDSFSWGMSNSGSMAAGAGGGAGKVSFGSVRIMAEVSKASPALFEVVATGKHLPSATIIVTNSELRGQEFMRVTLTDVLISSYQVGGTSGEYPTESFKLNFAKIEYEYVPQNPDGSMGATVKAGYDVAANKKI